MPDILDCLVVGAGPAGLVAANYLARFRRRIAVVDAGASRARWIPTSHNCPGFPLGVSGTTLLARLREQAEEHGVVVTPGRIDWLLREAHGHGGSVFVARDAAGQTWRAATVILATGIVDRLPEVEGGPQALAAAIEAGTLRLCAVCDAYEARDSRIAVLAPADDAQRHAAFLRTFSRTVDAIDSGATYRLECDADGCRIETAPGEEVGNGAGSGAGAVREYDTLYPVLGSDSQSQLAQALGAAVDDEGALRTDAHQQTSVDGLYAVGDVVSALNQIAVAVGHAAIAATAVHNRLPPNPRGPANLPGRY